MSEAVKEYFKQTFNDYNKKLKLLEVKPKNNYKEVKKENKEDKKNNATYKIINFDENKNK